MHNLDKELEEVLRGDSRLSDKLVEVSKVFIKLLSKLYGEAELPVLIKMFLDDVCKTREFVLALYLPIAIVLSRFPELAESIPEEVSRQYLSMLLVLYEKSKHVYSICRGGVNAR